MLHNDPVDNGASASRQEKGWEDGDMFGPLLLYMVLGEGRRDGVIEF